jgi:hypothetical protein
MDANTSTISSMLQTTPNPAHLGSRSGTVETNPDASTDTYFGCLGPSSPNGTTRIWLRTVPSKCWWVILHLSNPIRPFFDTTWPPSEIEPI